MNRLVQYSLLFALIFTFAAIANAQSSGAPPIYEVKFEKGAFIHKGTVHPVYPCPPNGPTECGNGSSTSLSLRGTKGMRVRIMLVSDTGDAVFSILLPDHSAMKDSSSRTSWTGTLPANGDFPIYVYTNKSFTHYTLKVTKLN